MTRISYIHGIPEDEIADRSKGVPNRSFIDYPQMTDGHLRLQLILEQLNILSGFYPDNQELFQAQVQLSDYLAKGIGSPFIGITKMIPFLRKEIRKARKQTKKASAINNKLIDLDDCSKYLVWDENPYGDWEWRETDEYDKCKKDNRYKGLLNDHLEETSHHLLYNYIEQANQSPTIVVAKSLQHSLAIENLAKITGLGKSNLKLWVRNGILRSNVSHGMQPLQPETTIHALKTGGKVLTEVSNSSSQVSGFITGAFLVLKILSAATAAILAANKLISNMKPTEKQQMQNASANFGLDSFGPEDGDWPQNEGGGNNNSGGNNNGGGNNNNPPSSLLTKQNLIIGGVAAFLLLNNNEE